MWKKMAESIGFVSCVHRYLCHVYVSSRGLQPSFSATEIVVYWFCPAFTNVSTSFFTTSFFTTSFFTTSFCTTRTAFICIPYFWATAASPPTGLNKCLIVFHLSFQKHDEWQDHDIRLWMHYAIRCTEMGNVCKMNVHECDIIREICEH